MSVRRIAVAGLMALVVAFGIAVESGVAAEPFQLALFTPIQLRDESVSITILRLNLIYGRNVSVHGLDLGLINHCTGGNSVGLQYGLVGYNQGDYLGWQNNFITVTGGRFTGLQSGAFNQMGNGEGVQWGFINVASNASGLQLGIVNYTEQMYGLQIGLVNIIKQKEDFPILPLINWSF